MFTGNAISQTPAPIAYTSFKGSAYSLYPYAGRNVVLLVASPDLDVPTLNKILVALDSAYELYARTTGQTPAPNPPTMYQGRSTIAEVTTTCGAGCGYLGTRGIEIEAPYFDELYNGVLQNDQFDQPLFYELGRNFWFYCNKIEYRRPDAQTDAGAITTGYAVFMRFMAMDAAGVTPAPFRGHVDFAFFRSQVEGLVDLYGVTGRVGGGAEQVRSVGRGDQLRGVVVERAGRVRIGLGDQPRASGRCDLCHLVHLQRDRQGVVAGDDRQPKRGQRLLGDVVLDDWTAVQRGAVQSGRSDPHGSPTTWTDRRCGCPRRRTGRRRGRTPVRCTERAARRFLRCRSTARASS